MSELKVYVPQDGPYGLEPEEGGEPVEEETCYLKSEVDAAIAELKAALKESEDARYEAGADAADYYQENRRLKRALWLARANDARNSYLKWNLFANFESKEKLFTIDEYDETPGATDGQVLRTYTEWLRIWQNVERKCRAKAEEYK